MAFHFKQFDVEDSSSTLRIGTDAMLLGAWASPGDAMRILDIGTGCGVLALMMAQKSHALIDAIDIDSPSVIEAQLNFSRSPWGNRLKVSHEALQALSATETSLYDFILTNPPYFANLLKSPSTRKNTARHDHSLSHHELVKSAAKLLTADGRLSLILPADKAESFIILCKNHGLHLSRRLNVCHIAGTAPRRTLMEFAARECSCYEETVLTIRNLSGAFSAEYLDLTGSFHNF
jgi:tRNA1Val (adenine37-N6)-methyltransferase